MIETNNNVILFNKALDYINRQGVKELADWLKNETDFFTAPASTKYHCNYEGGLLQHSLNVLECALNNYAIVIKKQPKLEYLKESVILCALFHDICKVNVYKTTEKFAKNKYDKWVKYMGYEMEDTFPFGHGEKSVYYILKFVELTNAEALAIRWHQGPWDGGLMVPGYSKWSFDIAIKEPLVLLIHAADLLSTTFEPVIDHKANAM